MFDMTEKKFLDKINFDVFTFGRPPICIEILTQVKGLHFAPTFFNAQFCDFDNQQIKIIDIKDLRIAKKAANRLKDQDDLEHI